VIIVIIRKPYAFLIKYFKIIHIIIFVLFGYFLFAYRDLYMFFKEAVLSSSVYGSGLENNYVSALFFIVAILMILLSLAIYLLMKRKNKPVLFYQLIMGYAFVSLILFFMYRSYFTHVGNTEYTTNSLVLYRDLGAIIYFVSYLFVGFSFARAFGFDIKKFSFDKDKKELNISQADNEEYELNINLDKDKIMNQIRKERRNIRYYIEDNKVILKKIGIGLGALLFVYLLVVIFIFNKSYGMNSWIDIPNYNSSIKIDKVYLTNKDPYQEIHDRKNNYVGVVFTVRVGNYNIAFDNRILRMKLAGEYYYPTHQSSAIFSDLAPVYNSGDRLGAHQEITNIFLFSYDKKITSRRMTFEILLNGKYHRVRTDYLEQDNLDEGYQLKEFKVNESVPIFDGGFTISGYKFVGGNAEYQYNSKNCDSNGECKKLIKKVQPKLNEKILELDVKFNDNKDNIKTLEYYISIEYEIDGKQYLNSAKTLTILDHVTLDEGQKMFLSIYPKSIHADKKYLVITTRDTKYSLELTGENE